MEEHKHSHIPMLIKDCCHCKRQKRNRHSHTLWCQPRHLCETTQTSTTRSCVCVYVCVCVCGHSACWQLVCLSILSAGAELRLPAKTLPQLLSPLLSFPFCLQLLFVSVLKRYTRSLLFITLRHRCNSLIGRLYIKRLASLNDHFDRSQKSFCLSIRSLLHCYMSRTFC